MAKGKKTWSEFWSKCFNDGPECSKAGFIADIKNLPTEAKLLFLLGQAVLAFILIISLIIAINGGNPDWVS